VIGYAHALLPDDHPGGERNTKKLSESSNGIYIRSPFSQKTYEAYLVHRVRSQDRIDLISDHCNYMPSQSKAVFYSPSRGFSTMLRRLSSSLLSHPNAREDTHAALTRRLRTMVNSSPLLK
jgi:hypothetical protein